MKDYPSIPHWDGSRHFGKSGLAFRKYDGSNIRFKWNPKRGWYKYGTRTPGSSNPKHPVFGGAVNLFHATFGDQIERRVSDAYRKPRSIIAFCEFFGPHSFSGQHDPAWLKVEANDPKQLVLIDVDVFQQCFVPPATFVRMFDGLAAAELVREVEFTEAFCKDVWDGNVVDGEGVIVKGGERHGLWMTKVKTQAYMKRLEAAFGVNWRRYW